MVKNDLKKAPKTGGWRYMKPEVNPEKCIACGTCVKFCPEACIELMGAEKKIAEIDFEWCKGCGVCAAVCPVKAIIMKKN